MDTVFTDLHDLKQYVYNNLTNPTEQRVNMFVYLAWCYYIGQTIAHPELPTQLYHADFIATDDGPVIKPPLTNRPHPNHNPTHISKFLDGQMDDEDIVYINVFFTNLFKQFNIIDTKAILKRILIDNAYQHGINELTIDQDTLMDEYKAYFDSIQIIETYVDPCD